MIPNLSFFLATADDPVDEHHPLWHRPLPESRRQIPEMGPSAPADAVTYGQYFTAVAQFCTHNGCERLLHATARRLKRPVAETDLRGLAVFLEKHGAFYHPARIRLTLSDQTVSFVVNVAASEAGRKALPVEVGALRHLATHRPFGWVPTVYAQTTGDLPMFLGDWFDGFHEFHLTREKDGEKTAIVIWDRAAKRRLLKFDQVAALYREMAMILTALYDPVTARGVFPWHHAAGDFVVRLRGDGVTVRLVTVRDYPPFSGTGQALADETAVLDALVGFFLHLSIHLRLDRLDGVAEVAWAPDECIAPIVEGFFQGLDLCARISGFPEAFPEMFRHYLRRCDGPALSDAARQAIEALYEPRSEERGVVDGNLADHIRQIGDVLSGG